MLTASFINRQFPGSHAKVYFSPKSRQSSSKTLQSTLSVDSFFSTWQSGLYRRIRLRRALLPDPPGSVAIPRDFQSGHSPSLAAGSFWQRYVWRAGES
jgi:hypothetical protein